MWGHTLREAPQSSSPSVHRGAGALMAGARSLLAPCSLQDSTCVAISVAGEGGPGSIEDGDEGSRKLAARSHGEASAAPVRGEIKQP